MENLILVNIGNHFLSGEILIASYFLQYCDDERVHAEIESYRDMLELLRQIALMQIFHMHFNRISLIKQTQQFGV